jgi:hypothetical protein
MSIHRSKLNIKNRYKLLTLYGITTLLSLYGYDEIV